MATTWPCTNHPAPRTCLTHGVRKRDRCDHCTAQADAVMEAAAEELGPTIHAAMEKAWFDGHAAGAAHKSGDPAPTPPAPPTPATTEEL